jgi:hypothetical protein
VSGSHKRGLFRNYESLKDAIDVIGSKMTLDAGNVVSAAMSTFTSIEIPQSLLDRIEQHQKTLLNLTSALIAGGQPEDVIEKAVGEVVTSFRIQLVKTIVSIGRGAVDA